MNKVILIGRLAKDPAISNKYARYTIAVDRPVKQEGQNNADFINCIVFGKGIDFVEKYLHKGLKIAIEGRIQTGSYTKEDGTTVYTTDVIVDRHEFCESRNSSSSAIPSGHHELEELQQFPNVEFQDLDDTGDLPF